jgi:hypothetical protein
MLFATYSWFFLAPGYTVRVSYPVVGAQTANERSRGLPLAGDVMRRLFTGKDMLTDSPPIVSHRRIRYAARCRDANFASV